MSRDRFRSLREYDDSLGGLIPSIGAQIVPGMDGRGAVLSETEDWDAYSDTPAAREIASADEERRRRPRDEAKRLAAQRALRAMQEAPPDDPLASLQMDPEDVAEMGERFDESVGDPVRAGAASLLDALVLPRAALGALNEVAGVDDYGATVQRARRGAAEARAEHPWASAVGMLGAMPAAFASPQVATTAATPAMGRFGAAGLESMAYGALPGLVSGDLEEAATGSRNAGLVGGTLAAGVQSLQYAAPTLNRAADAIDEWSAPIRARAAGIRGIGAQRRVDQLPGSTRQFVRDLDRLGISPRGSIGRVDDVGDLADAARQRAIAGIQDARDQMAAVERGPFAQLDEAVRADDPMMAPTPETRRALVADRIRRGSEAERQAVERAVADLDGIRNEIGPLAAQRAGAATRPNAPVDVEALPLPVAAGDDITRPTGRARPMVRREPPADPTVPGVNTEQVRELRRELGRRSGGRPNLSQEDVRRAYDDGDFTDVFGQEYAPSLPNVQRQPGLPPRDARSPSAEDLRSLIPQGFGNTVSGPEIARRLRGIIGRYREIPGAESLYATGEQLAGQMEARGRISWGDAEEIRRFWDDITNWQAQGPTASPLAPLQGVRRQMRGALQGVLDETVAEHAPRIAEAYPQARRDYQVSDFTSRMAREDELRDASNRLISPSDYGGGIIGSGIGSAAAGPSGGVVGGIAGVLANRAVRGREHALSAATAERGADLLRAIPLLRASRATGPAMGAMGASSAAPDMRPRGGVPLGPETVSDDELEQLLAAPTAPTPAPATAPATQPTGPEPETVDDDELERLLAQEYGQ